MSHSCLEFPWTGAVCIDRILHNDLLGNKHDLARYFEVMYGHI